MTTTANPLSALYDLSANWFAELQLNDAWEPLLERWERPASPTEETQIERAARMVRDAIAAHAWLTKEGVIVEPQGSYHNNTNVRLEAEMDLRVVHPTAQIVIDPTVEAANDHARTNYVYFNRSPATIAAELRAHVQAALETKFGSKNVEPGKKAFRISAVPGSRADIDIVPALTLDFITLCAAPTIFHSPYVGPIRGIAIHGTDGTVTWNFPYHHHRLGKEKRENTDYAFKKVVRQLKSMRDSLVEDGMLAKGAVPSFLIECLAYRVEHGYFKQDIMRRARLKRILQRSWEQLIDPAWTAAAREINEMKLLFGSHQPWTPRDAQAFVALALAELDK